VDDPTKDIEYLVKRGFPVAMVPQARFLKGAGCDECRQIGYQGRTGIYELLVVTEGVRPLILNRAPASKIAEQSIREGTQTLRLAGWNKTQLHKLMDLVDPSRPDGPRQLRHQPTTVEEVLRVTQSEEHLSALMEVR